MKPFIKYHPKQIIFILTLAAGLTVGLLLISKAQDIRNRAQVGPTVTLSLNPVSSNITVGSTQPYLLTATFSSGSSSQHIDYFRTQIEFDTTSLQLPSTGYIDTSSSGFNRTIQIDSSSSANSKGAMIIELGALTAGSGPVTSAPINIATINFVGSNLTSTQATIHINPSQTQVVDNLSTVIPLLTQDANYQVVNAAVATVTPTPLPAITFLSATASCPVSAPQINLSWAGWSGNVVGSSVTSYLIERCSGVGCSAFSQIANIAYDPSAPTTTWVDTTVILDGVYSYRVRALINVGVVNNYSDYSPVATAAANCSGSPSSTPVVRPSVTTGPSPTTPPADSCPLGPQGNLDCANEPDFGGYCIDTSDNELFRQAYGKPLASVTVAPGHYTPDLYPDSTQQIDTADYNILLQNFGYCSASGATPTVPPPPPLPSLTPTVSPGTCTCSNSVPVTNLCNPVSGGPGYAPVCTGPSSCTCTVITPKP